MAELLYQIWTTRELILIVVVALWIPALKVSIFIYSTFGIKVKHLFPTKHYREVLYTLYSLAVAASILNLMEKMHRGYNTHNLIILALVYAFVLYMDYLETKEIIKRIDDENKK